MTSHVMGCFQRIFSAGILACLVLVACAGCSNFDHDWNAAASVKPADEADFTGRWQGKWVSDGGHNGDLRCLITRVNENTFHAHYAATYASVLHFEYEMNLEAQREGDWIRFRGQADLGAMAGGIYHYDGHANAVDFYCTYKSDADQGNFTMKRP